MLQGTAQTQQLQQRQQQGNNSSCDWPSRGLETSDKLIDYELQFRLQLPQYIHRCLSCKFSLIGMKLDKRRRIMTRN